MVGGTEDALFAVMLALPRCHGNKTRQPRVKRDRENQCSPLSKLPSSIAMARSTSVSQSRKFERKSRVQDAVVWKSRTHE